MIERATETFPKPFIPRQPEITVNVNIEFKEPTELAPSFLAHLAIIAGAVPDIDHGFTFNGNPINKDAITWFLAGAYKIEATCGKSILAAGAAFAREAKDRAKAIKIAAALRAVDRGNDGMFDPLKIVQLALMD
ncbi:hypothetical protein [Ferribacterium limneticum]|uniref:hypothetical protein n=1 Tax=Ferribacterium limneticum TaxID=76259 RepID=UPI001CFB1D68|nr:hypothetical protein [Ferribacterium limneticum]UCV26995.1 hypothetical protein KI617_11865 [Ferribacterium limneticum]UCV30912.1 hypothetical protein KI608_11865 [Ferribacterium limneticum]